MGIPWRVLSWDRPLEELLLGLVQEKDKFIVPKGTKISYHIHLYPTQKTCVLITYLPKTTLG